MLRDGFRLGTHASVTPKAEGDFPTLPPPCHNRAPARASIRSHRSAHRVDGRGGKSWSISSHGSANIGNIGAGARSPAGSASASEGSGFLFLMEPAPSEPFAETMRCERLRHGTIVP